MAKEVRHKTSKGKTILLRKNVKPKQAVALSQLQIKNMIWDYTQEKLTNRALAKKYDTTTEVINGIIRNFGTDFNNHTETLSLIQSQDIDDAVISTAFKQPSPTFKSPELINSTFLKLLSHPKDTTLTEPEQTYCWIYAFTNDNNRALRDSGLTAGLKKRHSVEGKSNTSFQNAVKMRGYYLRSKENLSKYIRELREDRLQDLKIDKGYVQSQLVSDIEYMNEEADVARMGVKLKAIDLLGKTIPGCFSETIKVEEVKPDEALDSLLEMAKADVKRVVTTDNSDYQLIES